MATRDQLGKLHKLGGLKTPNHFKGAGGVPSKLITDGSTESKQCEPEDPIKLYNQREWKRRELRKLKRDVELMNLLIKAGCNHGMIDENHSRIAGTVRRLCEDHLQQHPGDDLGELCDNHMAHLMDLLKTGEEVHGKWRY